MGMDNLWHSAKRKQYKHIGLAIDSNFQSRLESESQELDLINTIR